MEFLREIKTRIEKQIKPINILHCFSSNKNSLKPIYFLEFCELINPFWDEKLGEYFIQKDVTGILCYFILYVVID